jgi:adenylate cyclase
MPMRLPRFADASLYTLCLVVLAAALVDLRWTHVVAPLDARLADRWVALHAGAVPPDNDVIVIDIDDASLEALAPTLGRFPWPRAVYGEIIDEMEQQHAAAVVMDVELYEPDLMNPESDKVLNEAVAKSDNTFFPIKTLPRIARDEGVWLKDVAPLMDFNTVGMPDPDTRVTMELPKVLDKPAWKRTGLIDFLEDDDHVGRRYWLYREFGGYRIPSLPARVAQDLGYALPEGDAVTLNDGGASMTLAWTKGGNFAHPHVAFADLYEDIQRGKRERPRDEFKGKVVVIGASATHLGDFRTTPVSGVYPGVEILATAIDNLKTGRHLTKAPPWLPYVLVLVLFVPVLRSLRKRGQVLTVFVILAALSAALAFAAYAALSWRSTIVLIATPLVFAWLFFFLAAIRAYLAEQKAKEQRERVLSRFLDPRLVKTLVAEGVKLEDIRSESRVITVLFSDIRGFTSLSERRPAEEIVAMLNAYLSRQTETLFRHGGTLDKFIGDAIMAFWNAPTDEPRHAQRAVDCAVDMLATLARFNEENAASGITLDIGIGIHTGPAVVGFVGSQRKLEYTAIGDTVNLASRIEGETKGRARILVSAATREQVSGRQFSEVAEVTVKGRAASVHLYTPEGSQ